MARDLHYGNVANGFDGFYEVPAKDRDGFVDALGGVVVQDFDGTRYLIPEDAVDRLRLTDDEVRLVREAAGGDPEVIGFEYRVPQEPNTFGLSFARWTDSAMTGKNNC